MTIAWTKSTEFYTNPADSKNPLAMFGNSYTGMFLGVGGLNVSSTFAWGAFGIYDATAAGVPTDAKYVAIGGIDIITGAADLMMAFRAPGSTTIPTWQHYQHQLLSASTALGARNVAFDIVPLSSGCFEAAIMAKKYPDDGASPGIGDGTHSVGWNISIKGWGR